MVSINTPAPPPIVWETKLADVRDAKDVRDTKGRFALGHPGGPGRPRRSIEREYLAALGEIVTVPRWRRVVKRALRDAIAGDAVARAWLSRYLLGENPPRLIDLAAAEDAGQTPQDEIQRAAEQLAALPADGRGAIPQEALASLSDDDMKFLRSLRARVAAAQTSAAKSAAASK